MALKTPNIEKRKINGVEVDWDTDLGGPITKIAPEPEVPEPSTKGVARKRYGTALTPRDAGAPQTQKDALKLPAVNPIISEPPTT